MMTFMDCKIFKIMDSFILHVFYGSAMFLFLVFSLCKRLKILLKSFRSPPPKRRGRTSQKERSLTKCKE